MLYFYLFTINRNAFTIENYIGLSKWLVNKLQHLQVLDVWVINLIICLLTASITEVVSNTATANILVPILKQMSATLCTNPVYLGKTAKDNK